MEYFALQRFKYLLYKKILQFSDGLWQVGGQSGERFFSAVDDSVLAAAGVGALRLRHALPSRALHQSAAFELLSQKTSRLADGI